MQTITRKEITVDPKLRSEIIYHHTQFQAARSEVFSAMQAGMWHRLQCGIRLNKAKSSIGQGNWTLWIESNLPFDERTAQRYMKVDNDNPSVRAKATALSGTKPDLQILTKLSEDTLRKHEIGFVREKEQPQHIGNATFPRFISFSNIMNEFNRILNRHIDGLQPIDWNEVREQSGKLYDTLKWVHGDAAAPPFKP